MEPRLLNKLTINSVVTNCCRLARSASFVVAAITYRWFSNLCSFFHKQFLHLHQLIQLILLFLSLFFFAKVLLFSLLQCFSFFLCFEHIALFWFSKHSFKLFSCIFDLHRRGSWLAKDVVRFLKQVLEFNWLSRSRLDDSFLGWLNKSLKFIRKNIDSSNLLVHLSVNVLHVCWYHCVWFDNLSNASVKFHR